MSIQDTTLDRSTRENGTNELPATNYDFQASPRLKVPKMTKSTLAIIGSRLRRYKTGTSTPDSHSQASPPHNFIADFDKEQKTYPRPEIGLGLSYLLVENREELDPKTLEAYNQRVLEMSGRLKTARRFGASAFLRGLAEEIVGTELRVRMYFDKIYSELIDEVKSSFEEALDRRRDNMKRTLESRPPYLSQRINKFEEMDDSGATKREHRMRGMRRF